MNLHSPKPIGIFDSGVGGLTVLRQIQQKLPNEQLIYFGDTARLPYGGKSGETVLRYCMENARFLLSQNIKMLVVACNTASAYGVDHLSRMLNIPVIGVIEPGVESALKVTKNGRIAVLGTKGTIQSGTYQKELLSRRPDLFIEALACPLFVPLVEERWKHPSARLIVSETLFPLKNLNIDTLLLGCTHYPLLSDLIKKEVGDRVEIVDSASSCAEKIAHALQVLGIAERERVFFEHVYHVSDDPEKFSLLAEEFLGAPLKQVELTLL
jgi:glutamate racemase